MRRDGATRAGRHRCEARARLAATLRDGPAVVGRGPGRRTPAGGVLVGPVTLAFGGEMADAPCRLNAAVRWLQLHGAGRVDVVLRDRAVALLVAWPCGVAARRPQRTEGDAVRAAVGVRTRLERARSRDRAGAGGRGNRRGRR